MEILKVIKERRSIRAFKNTPIKEEIVDMLIEAILWAPSAGNLQSRFFYLVFNQKLKEELAKAALDQDFIAEAPLVVVLCGDLNIEKRYGKRGKEFYMIQDVAASVQNLLLVAHSLGLGSVWVGAFEEEGVRKLSDIPKHLVPLVIVPIGFPNEIPEVPERVKKEAVVKIIP